MRKYLQITLLLLVTLLMGVATNAIAADWSTSSDSTVSGKFYETKYTTLTNLDVSTTQLGLDACSSVSVVYDPSVAVTATVIAGLDSAGTVSHTVISSSGNIAVSGTSTTLPIGTLNMHITMDGASPSTVGIAVTERRFINCNSDYLD